ncbi:MAG TPA: class I SAM-dependent methyltransferase [Acidimicrobiales bacterium]|nr:class I SAM-dependent methyltransferase [Acidimicrobiales bacterium]
MAPRSFLLDDTLDAYVQAHSPEPDLVTAALVDRTAQLGDVAGMQIGHDQAAFLTAICAFAGVTNAVEVGTFTGRSSLAIASGLAPGGHLVCCDVSDEWTSIARDAWRDAGVEDRVELRLGPAIETLRALPDDAAIDLAFVDADKTGYPDYYTELVPRLRPGGLLLADNTLWHGRIVDEPSDDDSSLAALRRYNDRAAADPRVRTTILTIGDGVTLSQRL